MLCLRPLTWSTSSATWTPRAPSWTRTSPRCPPPARLEFPDDEQIVERQTWPPEISERHLALRAAVATVATAATAVRQHPTMQQALREGCPPVTKQALKDAARTAEMPSQ